MQKKPKYHQEGCIRMGAEVQMQCLKHLEHWFLAVLLQQEYRRCCSSIQGGKIQHLKEI